MLTAREDPAQRRDSGTFESQATTLWVPDAEQTGRRGGPLRSRRDVPPPIEESALLNFADALADAFSREDEQSRRPPP